jgi:predicted S18 family serine protease
VQPQKGDDVTVGFYESEVGGNGDMWRSSGWMGTSVAAFLSKKNSNDYKIDFTTKGRIDGPSAGTLMTVGVLSALLGDTISKDVTMTGTINPDGTVGPVGGIVHKLQGAKDAGKKTVLVPISQRYDTNVETGESVDLVAEGKKLGIEVKEVATIFDAYKEITGKTLARYAGTIGDPQLASATYDKLKLKVNEWKARLSELKNKIKTYNASIQESFYDSLQEISTDEAKVQTLVSQGEMPAAYTKIVETTLKAAIVQSALDIVMTIINNGLAGIDSYLNSTYSNTEQVK